MLQSLPSIDQVLSWPELAPLLAAYSRDHVAGWARSAVEELRRELQGGRNFALGEDGKLSRAVVLERVHVVLARMVLASLRVVVNATGVVIHTNLGRAPLGEALIKAMAGILGSYSNLEFDLEKGERGSRHVHLAPLLRLVTGAEDGLVVNNNAAGVLVSLNTLARGREVVVSRGELIEIGGSFRIPEIIERSGAVIREVGTTNKTRIADYEKAVSPETALILKVHTSNYKVVGFTEEARLKELVEFGNARGIPVMVDLGSGLLCDLAEFGLRGEKPVRFYVEEGADLVCFSGDKLLGGPQAGFIVGRGEFISRIKQNPLVRALRVGKLTLSALQVLLSAYLAPSPPRAEVPALGLLLRPAAELKTAARRLARKLSRIFPRAELRVEEDETFAGGGSLPAEPIPTFVVSVALPGIAADTLAAAFRKTSTPVVGRIKAGRFCLDCRTLLPGDEKLILAAAGEIASGLESVNPASRHPLVPGRQ